MDELNNDIHGEEFTIMTDYLPITDSGDVTFEVD